MGKEYYIEDFLKRIKRPVELSKNSSYKLVTIRLNHKGVILRELKKGSEIKSSMFLIKQGDFILSGIDARSGAFGIVPPELDNAIVTNDFWYFDIDESIISKKLFLEMTATRWFDEICKRGSEGTTQRIRLQKDKFFNQKVNLPERNEQDEILNLLSKFKSKKVKLISEIEHQQYLIKQLRRSILQDAVKGDLVLQNPKGEPASQLLKRIQAEIGRLRNKARSKNEMPLPPILNSEIPYQLPKSWVWCRLGEISTIVRGKGPKYSADGVYKMLNQKCIRWFEVDSQFSKSIDPKWYSNIPDSFLVKQGDVLINSTGEGTIGRCAVAGDEINGFAFDSHILNIRSQINQRFICLLINSDYGQQLIGKMKGATSTKQTELGVNNISKFIFPLPPLEEQNRIVEKVNELMELSSNLEKEIAHSKEQADYLLNAILRETFIAKEEVKIVPLHSNQALEDQHFVKRKVLATYIINQSLHDKQFGDTKFEKLLHLSDYHAIKRNLGQAYIQKVAGPYDNAFTILYFNQIESSRWFTRTRIETQFVFKAGQNHGQSIDTYSYFSKEELQKVSMIINYFKNSDYAQPEIVSTLYAVWNNRVIRHQEISDNLLIEGFYDWAEQKKKYEINRLKSALQWMRSQNLVPDGWGKTIEKAKKSKKSDAKN